MSQNPFLTALGLVATQSQPRWHFWADVVLNVVHALVALTVVTVSSRALLRAAALLTVRVQLQTGGAVDLTPAAVLVTRRAAGLVVVGVYGLHVVLALLTSSVVLRAVAAALLALHVIELVLTQVRSRRVTGARAALSAGEAAVLAEIECDADRVVRELTRSRARASV